MLTRPEGRDRRRHRDAASSVRPDARLRPCFGTWPALVAPLGVAVLSYDRRPAVGDDDVPFEAQAEDAEAAVAALGTRLGQQVPIGLWAFSQGAWAAPIVAARSPRIAFLILVGSAGVCPAEQMRFSAAEALRRAGYDGVAVERAIATRRAVDGFLSVTDVAGGRAGRDRRDRRRALVRAPLPAPEPGRGHDLDRRRLRPRPDDATRPLPGPPASTATTRRSPRRRASTAWRAATSAVRRLDRGRPPPRLRPHAHDRRTRRSRTLSTPPTRRRSRPGWRASCPDRERPGIAEAVDARHRCRKLVQPDWCCVSCR